MNWPRGLAPPGPTSTMDKENERLLIGLSLTL